MKALLLGVLGVACVVGPWITTSPVRDLREWRRVGSWEAVPATVTSVSERRLRDPDSRTRTRLDVEVHFAYEYGGARHQGSYHMQDAARRDIPSRGERLTMKVNPRNPSQALSRPETQLPIRALMAFLLGAFGAWLLWKVLTGRADQVEITSDEDENRDRRSGL